MIGRILSRPRRVTGLSLIQDEDGQPPSYTSLRSQFDVAREAAGVSFQFRDIRAKAATDLEDLPHAQKLLAHKRRATTEGYAGRRKRQQVAPLNRDFVEENAVFVESGEQPLPTKPA